jgi:hypothetical protein
LQATIDLARVAPFLDVRDAIAGTIGLDATARGPLSALAIEGQLLAI